MGPADGKLMVGMAAFAPLALGMGALLKMMVFVGLRLRGEREPQLRGSCALYRQRVKSVSVGCLSCRWYLRSQLNSQLKSSTKEVTDT